jgi:toxin YoeB
VAPAAEIEKLVGDLAGAYSRRINVQHRLVYQILPKQRTVKVLRMWTHYE